MALAETVPRTGPTSPTPAVVEVGSRPYMRAAQGTRESLVAAAVALGALGVVYMWWRSVQGAGPWLSGAGRVTGLVGTYLVVVEVLLMSSVTWLDNLTGAGAPGGVMSNLCQTFTRCWRRGAPPFHSVEGMQDGAGMRAPRRRAGRADRQ